jgi:hypothetical protein
VSADALREAFNAAFADYLLKFPPFDTSAWQTFLQRQGADLSRSRAALRSDAVTAFILITPRTQRRTRIAAMGAVPAERGSGRAAPALPKAHADGATVAARWRNHARLRRGRLDAAAADAVADATRALNPRAYSSAAIAANFATVFRLRAVPVLAAGIFSLDVPMPST